MIHNTNIYKNKYCLNLVKNWTFIPSRNCLSYPLSLVEDMILWERLGIIEYFHIYIYVICIYMCTYNEYNLVCSSTRNIIISEIHPEIYWINWDVQMLRKSIQPQCPLLSSLLINITWAWQDGSTNKVICHPALSLDFKSSSDHHTRTVAYVCTRSGTWKKKKKKDLSNSTLVIKIIVLSMCEHKYIQKGFVHFGDIVLALF